MADGPATLTLTMSLNLNEQLFPLDAHITISTLGRQFSGYMLHKSCVKRHSHGFSLLAMTNTGCISKVTTRLDSTHAMLSFPDSMNASASVMANFTVSYAFFCEVDSMSLSISADGSTVAE